MLGKLQLKVVARRARLAKRSRRSLLDAASVGICRKVALLAGVGEKIGVRCSILVACVKDAVVLSVVMDGVSLDVVKNG